MGGPEARLVYMFLRYWKMGLKLETGVGLSIWLQQQDSINMISKNTF